MTFEQIRKYTTGLLKQCFQNKNILDKVSEDDSGNLLFNNKKINTNVSEKENNSIIQEADGIYSQDKTQEISDLRTRINQVSITQKTTNEELGFGYAIIPENICGTTLPKVSNFSQAVTVPFAFQNGTIPFDDNTNSFILEEGKTYRISSSITLTDGTGSILLTLTDINTNAALAEGCIVVRSASDSNMSPCPIEFIYKPVKTTSVAIKISYSNGSNAKYSKQTKISNINSYFIVQEIGRTQTIDPLEYVNEEEGIEDTPVGNILTYMGTKAPKHYLVCDGSEYNITDYPYLAQHFIDNFGSINYFGGDGVNTFTVPDLRGEFLRGTGTNSHENQGSGSDIGQHQDATIHKDVFTEYSRMYIASTAYEEKNADNIIHQHYRIWWDGNYQGSGDFADDLYTSRPTNTSVLYCIKYEPTYYTKITKSVSLEEVEVTKQQNELLKQEIENLKTILDEINRTVV